MDEVKYRLVNPGLRPRRTKLEMPGWAGQPEPRADGAQEYAWHCAPFTESAQYGIEVFYPYENELHVTRKNGKLEPMAISARSPTTAICCGRRSAASATTITAISYCST